MHGITNCLWLHIFPFFSLLKAVARASLNVEAMLHSYSNPTSEDCDGGNCEGVSGTCDNVFTFCLQMIGSTSCIATTTTDDLENDIFMFNKVNADNLGIINPLVYSNLIVSVSNILLHVTLKNAL